MLHPICLLPLLLPPLAAAARPQKILLSNVQILTLRGNGAMTAARRLSSIPQLRCVSPHPPICALHPIDIMRCSNQGSSYGAEDIEWSCAAELPADLKLASTDVVCEGFDDPDDPYILKGSCGVEYVLALTDRGAERYPHLARISTAAPTPDAAASALPWFDDGRGGEDYAAWLFACLFLAVLAWILYSACFARSNVPARISPPHPESQSQPSQDVLRIRGRGYDLDRRGGGGVGGWNPAWGGPSPGPRPPPYYDGRHVDETRQDYDSTRGGRYDAGGGGSGYAYTRQRGWTPGFWSGFTGGAATGYVAGRSSASSSSRTRTRNDADDDHHRFRAPWDSSPAPPRPSATTTSGPRPPLNSSSGSLAKSDRYEGIGLGSTRRR